MASPRWCSQVVHMGGLDNRSGDQFSQKENSVCNRVYQGSDAGWTFQAEGKAVPVRPGAKAHQSVGGGRSLRTRGLDKKTKKTLICDPAPG